MVPYKKFFFLALIIVFSGCSVNKRIYRNGYQVECNKKLVKSDKSIIDNKAKIKSASVPFNKVQDVKISEGEFNLCENSNLLVSCGVQNEKYVRGDDTCTDVIYLRNGEEINVKITEVTEDEVKYYYCKNVTSASMYKEYIFKIKYANGSFALMDDKKALETNEFAKYSMFCAAAFIFLFPAIPGIIFGIIALTQIKKNPKQFKGRGLAALGLVLNLVFLVGWIAMVLIFGGFV